VEATCITVTHFNAIALLTLHNTPVKYTVNFRQVQKTKTKSGAACRTKPAIRSQFNVMYGLTRFGFFVVNSSPSSIIELDIIITVNSTRYWRCLWIPYDTVTLFGYLKTNTFKKLYFVKFTLLTNLFFLALSLVNNLSCRPTNLWFLL